MVGYGGWSLWCGSACCWGWLVVIVISVGWGYSYWNVVSDYADEGSVASSG